MRNRVLCILLAVCLIFGSGLQVLATSVSEVKQQQTQTKNKLEEVNKSIAEIEKKIFLFDVGVLILHQLLSFCWTHRKARGS